MKNYFFAVLTAMLLMTPAMAQAQNKQGKTLEVSFDYQKQAGPGSNQYAVWIENEKGDVVYAWLRKASELRSNMGKSI